MSSLQGTVGLLGKAPCQADFLRLNAPSPAVHAFHRWLEEGLSTLPPASRTFPAEPVTFLFTGHGEATALLGVMSPSTDAVGRHFPLCVFQAVEASGLAGRLAAALTAAQPFFNAARELIAQSATVDAKALAAGLAALPALTEQAVTAAQDDVRAALGTRTAGALVDAIGRTPAGAPQHALRTVLAACAREKGQPPAKANALLDCPLGEGVDALPWVELASRLLGWKQAAPAFFAQGTSRLLLSLGPPPPSTLGFLANPAHTGTKLWPLRTADPSVLAASRAALAPAQAQALDQDALSLEALFAQLTA